MELRCMMKLMSHQIKWITRYVLGCSVFQVTLLLLCILNTPAHCDSIADFEKNIPAKIVWAALDKDAQLPCDISHKATDAVKLVLWFKDSSGIPLYTLDSRHGAINQANHSVVADELGDRLIFTTMKNNPTVGNLLIRDVKPSDGAIYRCRVDFFNSPTRNSRINLTLVEPPDEPRIYDTEGREVLNIAGPFREGTELSLECRVTGGNPLPKLSWWRNGEKLKTIETAPAVDGASTYPVRVSQHLFISKITREFFGSSLECHAQGSEIIAPTVKEVTVQLYLKPIVVRITNAIENLSAGKLVPLRCESWGSFPPAKITWLMDGQPIRNAKVTTLNDRNMGNVSVSILNFTASSENDGAELSCRSSNPWFSDGSIEARRKISVSYPPTVSIHLSNEDPNRVIVSTEGQNVTFKCRAIARPAVTEFSWFKDAMQMSGEFTESLNLIDVKRESTGLYSCGARNSEGESRSSTLSLKVQFAPRCKPGTEQTSVSAVPFDPFDARCEVVADPPEFVHFRWTYNNTRNVSPVQNSEINSLGLVSTLRYALPRESELITLACWASNIIGRQEKPCLIHVIPAKTPEPPKSCELRNDTILEVVCIPGKDGGLTQHFLLEIVGGNSVYNYDPSRTTDLDNDIPAMNDQATTLPLRRIEENEPEFKLVGLEPGKYQLFVYALNARGRSEPPVILDDIYVSPLDTPIDTTNTLLSDNKHLLRPSEPVDRKYDNIIMFAAIVAASGVILLAIVVSSILFACKHRRRPPEPQEIKKSMRPTRTDVPSMYAEDDDEDVYPHCTADMTHKRSVVLNVPQYNTYEAYAKFSPPELGSNLNVYSAGPDLIARHGNNEIIILSKDIL